MGPDTSEDDVREIDQLIEHWYICIFDFIDIPGSKGRVEKKGK